MRKPLPEHLNREVAGHVYARQDVEISRSTKAARQVMQASCSARLRMQFISKCLPGASCTKTTHPSVYEATMILDGIPYLHPIKPFGQPVDEELESLHAGSARSR